MLKAQKKHIDKEQGKTKHEAPLFIFFKMGIKIAGPDLKSRVGRVSGNTGVLGLRQSLVLIHHCCWLYHFFINKKMAITTAELLYLSRGI